MAGSTVLVFDQEIPFRRFRKCTPLLTIVCSEGSQRVIAKLTAPCLSITAIADTVFDVSFFPTLSAPKVGLKLIRI